MSQVYFSDIPRLYTAIAEWLACLMFLPKIPLRFTGLRLWGTLGLGLGLQCLFLSLTDGLPIGLWLPCMMGAVGLMFILILLCSSISLLSVGYFTACAFLTAEFAASLEWQLWSFFRHRLNWDSPLLSLAFLAVVYALVFEVMLWLTSRRKDPPAAFVFRFRELWPPVVISVTCFLMSNLSFVYSNTPFSGSAIEGIYNIRTLMDLAGVAMLYAYHVQRCELYMQRELDAIQNILQNQYIQYKQSRESIDVVNRKYHDLKHQIAILRAEQDPQRRMDFLDGMEEEIRTYESQNKTGNSVLDTVLTGKSLYCARHGIELTCVADGARLDFMDVMDLCSIFGNILDNAIECELGIQDKKKRLIHLAVYTKKDFLVIQCENYCEVRLEFQDGLPVSTKGDGAYHGYGIKSIRYAAEKYGGTMRVYNRDSWFEINIVIPLLQAPGPSPAASPS